jgi:ribose/xylose/arabinose/galactoside ABC-type transport system permease subunit
MSLHSRSIFDRLPVKFNELALLLAVLVVFLLTGVADSNHSYFNRFGPSITQIVREVSLLGIVALGAAVVIIAGGIDLSSGSMMAFSGVVSGLILVLLNADNVTDPHPSPLPILCALGGAVVAGIAVGTLHTWLITSVGLPPFVATLATLVGLRSFARVLCIYVLSMKKDGAGEEQFTVIHPYLEYIRDHVWVIVVVFAVLALFTWLLLSKTVLGRSTYALGGNENAARLSGIVTENVKWFAYCFSAVTAGIAGIFYMADVSGVKPNEDALGFELSAIAAAVVGGCSLQGGVGRIPGVVLGAIFLRVVIDAIAKLIKSQSNVYEGMIVGIVVVLAVTFAQLQELVQSGRTFFSGARGKLAIPTLAAFAALVAMSTTVGSPALKAYSLQIGLGVAAVMGIVLVTIERLESLRRGRRG